MVSEEPIIDQFRLDKCLATGSFSQIWEVTDQDTNERYAMKLLLEEAFQSSEQKSILKQEFKTANAFDHPNIIHVYTHSQSKKNAYYTMELFGGPNLKQIIRGERLVVHVRLRKLMECIVMALGQIHEKGWLHRDVKPDNIMMTRASDVRLIDFSLSAKAPSSISKMLSGKTKVIQGTRTYIAPELVRKKLPSFQSDFYSLGVSIFECLTGRPPFLGSTPNDLLIKHIQEPAPPASAFNPNVAPEMDKLLLRLMEKKPENRPASAGELLAELRSVKIFLEDPQVYDDAVKAKEKEAAAVSVEAKIDSRSDAQRTEQQAAGIDVPSSKSSQPKPAKKQPQKAAPAKAVSPQQAAPQQAQGQPQQPVMPQQPGYPQQPMMPQQPGMPPQAWPHGQPVAGQPMPGYPVQPPPGYQPVPPQQQVPQPGTVPAQATPPPKAPAAAPPKDQEEKVNLDDLPLMDELPDIS